MSWKDLISILLPDYCSGCGQVFTTGEKFLCVHCRNRLLETSFHQHPVNHIHRKFYGRCDLYTASSLFYFEKNTPIQQLIHELKYRNNEAVGKWFGEWLGQKLADIERFRLTEIVVPVPIHPKRLAQRGYNQVTLFGKELAKALNAEYCEDVLTKTTANTSQTQKNIAQRWQSNERLFALQKPERIEGRHVLLIDDIITTGATLEHCYHELSKAQNTKVSIATMAYVL